MCLEDYLSSMTLIQLPNAQTSFVMNFYSKMSGLEIQHKFKEKLNANWRNLP